MPYPDNGPNSTSKLPGDSIGNTSRNTGNSRNMSGQTPTSFNSRYFAPPGKTILQRNAPSKLPSNANGATGNRGNSTDISVNPPAKQYTSKLSLYHPQYTLIDDQPYYFTISPYQDYRIPDAKPVLKVSFWKSEVLENKVEGSRITEHVENLDESIFTNTNFLLSPNILNMQGDAGNTTNANANMEVMIEIAYMLITVDIGQFNSNSDINIMLQSDTIQMLDKMQETPRKGGGIANTITINNKNVTAYLHLSESSEYC